MVSAWLGLFELMTKTLNVELDVIPTVFYCYHLDLEYVQKEVKKKKKKIYEANKTAIFPLAFTEYIGCHVGCWVYVLRRFCGYGNTE